MKKTITILLILTLASACRMRKERETNRSAENSRQEMENRSSTYAWRQLDSNSRYWHFSTDNIFRYHPDSGLLAHGGILRMEESQIKSALQQSHDSSSFHLQENQHSQTISWKRYGNPWLIWLCAAVGCGILFYILHKWKNRK